ncbi:MAG: CpaF family protein [Acidimicrobiales bacterium]|nr:CpaF family protein [Acidimicrobiales bacterium]
MRLSDRLAAIDDDDVFEADPEAPGAPPRAKRHRARDDAWAEAKRKVRALVLEEVAPRMAGLEGDALRAEVRRALDEILQREEVSVSVSPIERRAFVSEVIADTLGYGPLDPLLHDDTVTEIMCNAFDDIWVERRGRLVEADVEFADDDQYRKVIERIVAAVGRRVDESSPMVDARLPDGSRVNAVIPPLAIHGAVLTIRKFASDPLTAMDLVDKGTYTVDLVTLLEACVRGKLNVLVSGGTGTGKTTNLNVMSSFVPHDERIITIEDSAELQLQQRHVVSLEARPANAEGRGQVEIRDLVRNALRMRPDRIIVGECRAGEALDMLQAMNTGHEGSMTTIHANTARDALSRLETMVLMAGFDLPIRAIREQIAAAVDVIVQVDRRPDGRRVVTAITEVQGLEGEVVLLQDIFTYRPGTGGAPGRLTATGLRPAFLEKLEARGAVVPAAIFRAPAEVTDPRPTRGPARIPDAATIAEHDPTAR